VVHGNVVSDSVGSGIHLKDTNNLSVGGNRCFDGRDGAAKTQQYGIREEGATSGNTVHNNQLAFNGAAQHSLHASTTSFNNDAGTTKVAAPLEFYLAAAGKIAMKVGSSGSVSLGGADGTQGVLVVQRASQINYFGMYGGIATDASGALNMVAEGASAVVDIRLTPKGATGRVQFGAYAAYQGTPITGTVEIRDQAGNLRKLAVVD
jgi:hypothetical protein